MVDAAGNPTSMGSGSDEETSLEDLVWSTMERQGFMGTLKAQIMKFVQDNGNVKPGIHVIPERADRNIMQHIFEYLDWVGMRSTSTMLISESPVQIDTKLYVHDDPPRLWEMFVAPKKYVIAFPEGPVPVNEKCFSENEEEDASFLNQNGSVSEDSKSHNGTYDDSFDLYSKSKAFDSCEHKVAFSLTSKAAEPAMIEIEEDKGHSEDENNEGTSLLDQNQPVSASLKDSKNANSTHDESNDLCSKSQALNSCDHKVDVSFGPELPVPVDEMSILENEEDASFLSQNASVSENSKNGTHDDSFDLYSKSKSKALESCEHKVAVSLTSKAPEAAVFEDRGHSEDREDEGASLLDQNTSVSAALEDSKNANSTHDESNDLCSKSQPLNSCDHVVEVSFPSNEADVDTSSHSEAGISNLIPSDDSENSIDNANVNTRDDSCDPESNSATMISCDHNAPVQFESRK